MKKSFIILALGMALLTGCGKEQVASIDSEAYIVAEAVDIPGDTDSETNGISFVDALGRNVVVSDPERVVSLLGSFCEEWYLAGGRVVGTVSDTFQNYQLDLGDTVTDLGSHMEPDVEAILALEPDFVIASSKQDAQTELLETLENAGITVAYFDVNNFEDYLNSLKIFTDITGRDDLYTKNGLDVEKEIEKAKEQIDGRKPTVLFVRAAATSVKVKGSKGVVGGEILADLDTINIADSDSSLEDLSMEAIILADPDYIFVTTQGSKTDEALANVEELMVKNPAWNSLKAVQNGNYYVIDKALYNSKPNARWGEAYQLFADIIYPKE